MDDDPAPSVRTQEGLVARAGRRGGARRQGVGHGQRRQHRAPPWPRALLRMGRHQGRGPPGDRHADPGARRARRRSCSTPAPTPSASPSGSCSSPRWAPRSPRQRYGIDEPAGRPAVDRRGGRPRATPLVKETHALLRGRAPGVDFIGNVEGRDLMTDDVDVVVTDGFTGNVALKTLEGGMRALVGAVFERVRRHRRGQGGGRGAAAGPAAAVRRRSTPTTPAAPCSSASTASASSATARRRPGRSSTPCGSPRDMVEGDLVDRLRDSLAG